MHIDNSKLHRPQDAVKLAFQAAYGAEHMLSDIQKAKDYFFDEYAKEHAPAPLVDKIAHDVIRVNLAAWKEAKLPPEWLFDLFVLSSGEKKSNPLELFQSYLQELGELAKKGDLPFSYSSWEEYTLDYNKNAKPTAVHHSDEYRKKEKPAYRIISGHFTRLVPILASLSGHTNAVIGIDGRAASGKSTMADALAKILQTEPIRMDDFFLPMELRTDKRLNEPGGNIHYELFLEDVIPNLRKSQPFSYKPFDCGIMDYRQAKTIQNTPYKIIEGAYSHHPHFGKYLDIKVFSAIEPDIQIERIKKRNGEATAETFINKWIPMEEKYFSAFKTEQKSDLVV